MSQNICAFSENGEYLAYSSPDGCLKIWETYSSVLKQEYTPSSHLSATCSCLSWGPIKRHQHESKKQKKSKTMSTSIGSLQLIAMGTQTGDVLLYSFSNAELYSYLKNGHTESVNCIAWLPSANSLYTCSNDMHLIIWDICEGTVKRKWKVGTVPIHSICLIDEDNILCSSSTIQLWNTKQKCIQKSFAGHATEICSLLSVPVENRCSYFLSSAKGDRVINAWNLNDDNIRGSAASFVSIDEPQHIDVLSHKNEPFTMSVVNRSGSLHIFKHTLNGKTKKPLHPTFTIHIASKSTSKACSVSILAAYIADGLDSILLAYGSFLKPVFERISIADETSTDLFLIRDLSASSAVTIEDSISKIKHTEKSKNVKMLAPGYMADSSILDGSSASSQKRKKIDIQELPMEERLKALDLSKPAQPSEDEINIKSDSMVHLLLQGLQSKDSNMLNTVLQCRDETVIKNTLQRLPLQSILLVLKELYLRLNKKEARGHPSLNWLNGLLSMHLPYLMSCIDIDEYLGPINQLFEARVENFYKMLRLKGCLEILMAQTVPETAPQDSEASKPLIEYESDSSADSEISDAEESYDDSDSKVDIDDENTDNSDSSSAESGMDI